MSGLEVTMMKRIGELNAEVCRLQADLEKSDGVVFTQAVENEALKAEVERLRKAGDEMASHILKIEEEVYEVTPCGGCYVINEWNAAKEGRPNE